MLWNVNAAVKHLEEHAASSPRGYCGQYVREAINAGGLNVVGAGYAGNYGPNLINQGFELIEECPADSGDTPWTTIFKAGDVVIYEEDASKGKKYGHAQMNTGKKGHRKEWISDFKQAGFWVYSSTRLPLRIYRHKQQRSGLTPGAIGSLPGFAPEIPGYQPPGFGQTLPTAPSTPGTTPTPLGTPVRTGAPYPGYYLRYGSQGADVRKVQASLTIRGWPLETDGDFGRLTKSSVVSFQSANTLSPDGVVGPTTWEVLFR